MNGLTKEQADELRKLHAKAVKAAWQRKLRPLDKADAAFLKRLAFYEEG